MVGGGVFTLSGVAVNEAGPSALLSYALAGVIMLISALSFVAVAGRARVGDSGYGPISTLLGPVWRFVVMWGFYINGVTILTFLLVSFGDYLHAYFVGGLGTVSAALLALVAIALLNLGPTGLVGKAEAYVVGLKIVLLLVFIGWGLAELGSVHLTPFAPDGAGGVLGMTALLFTAYTGFNVVTNMAGALKNPERTVPVAVIGSVLISGAIYIGVVLAMLASGVQDFGAAGLGQAAEVLMGDWGSYLIAFAAVLSTLSGANANVLGANELALRLAAQGDVPPALGRTTTSGHAVVSVLFIAAVTVLLVLFSNLNSIVALANVGALVAMIVVNAAAFRLARQGWPGEGLRLPGGVLIPLIGIATVLLQFPSLGWTPVVLGLALFAAGLALYTVRHQPHFGVGVAHLHRRLADADTPLGRALRHHPLRRS